MARLSANCSLGDQWYSQVAVKAEVERRKTILWISPFKKSFKQRHEWKECQDWMCRWLQCRGTFIWKPIKMWLSPVFPGCITSPWWVFSAQTSRCRRAHLLFSTAWALAEQHSFLLLLQPQTAPTGMAPRLCLHHLPDCPSLLLPLSPLSPFGWSLSGSAHLLPGLPHQDVPAPHCAVCKLIPLKFSLIHKVPITVILEVMNSPTAAASPTLIFGNPRPGPSQTSSFQTTSS